MSESPTRTGFSFELSESQPPVEAQENTPLEELVLDMGAFGPPQAPESESHFPQQESRVVDSPFSPLPVPLVSEPAEPTGSSPGPALSLEALSLDPVAPAEPDAPRIKKIQFPSPGRRSQSARALVGGAGPAKTGSAAKTASPAKTGTASTKTRFASSISNRPIRPDSEPPPEDPNCARGPGNDGLATQLDEPCDLPSVHAPLVHDEPWGTETPTAREIWQNARRIWKSTQKKAQELGGHGLRASSDLAKNVNAKMQASLQQAAERRAEQARAREQARAQAHDQASVSDGETLTEALPGTASAAGGGNEGEGRAARTSSPVTVMLQELTKTTAKKLAAPLSAACAAGLVYFAGTHFLGVDGRVALSRAVQTPQVPDLGTLEGQPSDSRGRVGTHLDSTRGRKDEAPLGKHQTAQGSGAVARGRAAAAHKEMSVEVAPMPEGLSWPGKGLIEVVTSEDELIYVDDVFTGRGPLRRIPVSPGTHEITIKSGGDVRSGQVEVSANKNTRAVFKSAP